MVFLLISFLELEYWSSDFPSNAIYKVSSRHWNSSLSVTRSLLWSTLGSVKNMKLVEIYQQIKRLIFPSHHHLDSPKIPKLDFTFDLSRHAKWTFTATTGFMSSTKIAIINFTLLRGNNGNNYALPSLSLASDSPKKSRSIFRKWSPPVFQSQVSF